MNYKRNFLGSHNNSTNNQTVSEGDQTIEIKTSDDNHSQGNKIYFYEDITNDSICNLNKQIDALTRQLQFTKIMYSLPFDPVIELHINSLGGSVHASLAAVDKINKNPINVHTYVEGIAASGATLISCVGKKRFIGQHSTMLIHQLSNEIWGTYAQFEDEMENMKLLMNLIKKVYCKHTNLKPKELETVLKHDLYLSADECLKLQLADEII